MNRSMLFRRHVATNPPAGPQRTAPSFDVARAKQLAIEFTVTVGRAFEVQPGSVLSSPGDDIRYFIGNLVADVLVGQRFRDPNYNAIARAAVIKGVVDNVVYWWTQTYGPPGPWQQPGPKFAPVGYGNRYPNPASPWTRR
jgi:hypothetical protein